MSLRLSLKKQIEVCYTSQLQNVAELRLDANAMALASGLPLELRYTSADEYVFNWLWGDTELRFDTAPLSRKPKIPPRQFYDVDRIVRGDPLTPSGAAFLTAAR